MRKPNSTSSLLGHGLQICLVAATATCSAGASEPTSSSESHSDDSSRFSDEAKPLQIDTFPARPAPLIEWGDAFLGTGNIRHAFTLPTGAVWHPSFWVYGDYRTAVQTYQNGTGRITEWANNLNLYGNLFLAATERIVVGIRPLEQNGQFTGYTFEPKGSQGWNEDFGGNTFRPRTLFFEGEFGEIFPKLDQGDKYPLDIGISVGRQPLTLQDGLIVQDEAIDLVSLTKNSILPIGGSTLRASAIFGWSEIDRSNNVRDHDAKLIGLDIAADYPESTFQGDVVYVPSSGGSDGLFLGVGMTRRFGKINTTFRVAQSIALDIESPKVETGTLLFAEMSLTPSYGQDIAYLNGFWGIDGFSSADRSPISGGPLGRVGILFNAVGLGHYGSALSSYPQNAAGGALGYQMFFGELRRRQLTFELGGRTPTSGNTQSAVATGIRIQQALGRRYIVRFDTFGGLQDNSREIYGGRMELQVKF
jgi:hypothetical protein